MSLLGIAYIENAEDRAKLGSLDSWNRYFRSNSIFAWLCSRPMNPAHFHIILSDYLPCLLEFSILCGRGCFPTSTLCDKLPEVGWGLWPDTVIVLVINRCQYTIEKVRPPSFIVMSHTFAFKTFSLGHLVLYRIFILPDHLLHFVVIRNIAI